MGWNLKCLAFCLFASVLCNLNCNILRQANQKMSFLQNFAPSVITAVFCGTLCFFHLNLVRSSKPKSCLHCRDIKELLTLSVRGRCFGQRVLPPAHTVQQLAACGPIATLQGKAQACFVYTICIHSELLFLFSVAEDLQVLTFLIQCILRPVYKSNLVSEANTD